MERDGGKGVEVFIFRGMIGQGSKSVSSGTECTTLEKDGGQRRLKE